jgi:hypothetical protein
MERVAVGSCNPVKIAAAGAGFGAVWPDVAWTCEGALAVVRRELWRHEAFRPSLGNPDMVNVPRRVVERLTGTVCHAT